MKKIITIILILTTFGTGLMCILSRITKDTKAPVISVPTEMITYEEGSDQSVLLAGVTASDDRDGDITQNVRIYDIAVMEDGKSAQIIYAAYDSSYNLGKRFRTVGYKAKRKEAPITDDMYSIINDNIDDGNNNTANEEEDTEEEVEPGYEDPVMESDGNPVIKLSRHELTLSVGDYFDTMSVIDDIVDDKDDRDALFNRVNLEGEYDMKKAGEYELEYYVTDLEGNESNRAKLMLIVED